MAAVLADCERHDDVPCRCPWRSPAWPEPPPVDIDALLDNLAPQTERTAA